GGDAQQETHVVLHWIEREGHVTGLLGGGLHEPWSQAQRLAQEHASYFRVREPELAHSSQRRGAPMKTQTAHGSRLRSPVRWPCEMAVRWSATRDSGRFLYRDEMRGMVVLRPAPSSPSEQAFE